MEGHLSLSLTEAWMYLATSSMSQNTLNSCYNCISASGDWFSSFLYSDFNPLGLSILNAWYAGTGMPAILGTTLLNYVRPLYSSGLKPIRIFNKTWHSMSHNRPVINFTVSTSNQPRTQARRSIFLFHNPLCDIQLQYSPYHQSTSLSQYSHILDFKQNAVEYIPSTTNWPVLNQFALVITPVDYSLPITLWY
jgi:hypothetical protein